MTDERRSRAEIVASMTVADRAAFYAQLPEAQIEALHHSWEWWGRPSQQVPGGEWTTWLYMGGRGVGKTRTEAETANIWARDNGRLAIIARTAADVRDVVVEGESGILAVAPPGFRPVYEPSRRRLTWPNGSIGTTFGAEEPDLLRGPQHDKAICDELAAWKYPEAWDNMLLGLRLGEHPQAIAGTTPKASSKLLRKLIQETTTVLTTGTTYDNAVNLAPPFLARIINRYKGTRLGAQEIGGQLISDVPGAVWSLDTIDRFRVRAKPSHDFARIVVSVDPASGGTRMRGRAVDQEAEEEGDETGVMVVGQLANGHSFVLEDLSCREAPVVLGPDGHPVAGWAWRAVQAYHRWRADAIVAEVNNGGEMVGYTVVSLDPRVNYQPVWASRGKVARAEPIAAIYARGLVHHVGVLAELEDQMTTWVPGDHSPDRMDALVWGLAAFYLSDAEEHEVNVLEDDDRVRISSI